MKKLISDNYDYFIAVGLIIVILIVNVLNK